MSALSEIGPRAKAAAAALAATPAEVKNAGLAAMAGALEARAREIVEANAQDVTRARADQTPDAIVDRLTLTTERIAGIAAAVRSLIGLTDPIGETIEEWTRPNGLRIRKVRVPLGVIGIIYEARPNVTVDAATLCLKSGNACILRGSASALATNALLVRILSEAGASAGLPADAIQLVEDTSREGAKDLMRAREFVDVLIPRGGAGLIKTVVEESIVPVLETGSGTCHVYVDAAADLDKALPIVLNAKVQRPSVCNAAETLLVHRAVAGDFLPRAGRALHDAGVELRGDAPARALVPEMREATEDDWFAEYLDLILAVKVVDSVEEAIAHTNAYGSHHTEAIVTEDEDAASRFAAGCDSACVMVNASTRFADGGEFGFGAEIGISNQKLHARGPMGLREMTSTKYVVTGEGQIRT